MLLRTLGELKLTGPTRTVLSSPRKELALLTYLCLHSARALSRAELTELFWSDREQAKARHSLRQALFELRQIVGTALEVTPETVRLCADAIELDASAFVEDVAAGRLVEAVERWQGDFLAGLDDLGGEAYRVWLEAERQTLRRQYTWALERLTADAERRGAVADAVIWAQRWAFLLPLDEPSNAIAVEALHRAGRSAEALARHAQFTTRFRDDVGCDPSAGFLEIASRIEQNDRASAALMPVPGSAAVFTPELVGREAAVRELQTAWRVAREGAIAVVIVEGHEGIGKTRLCEEFLRRTAEAGEPAFVLRARAANSNGAVIPEWTTSRELLAGLRTAPGLGGAPDRALGALSLLVPTLRERFPQLPQNGGDVHSIADALTRVLEDVSAEVPVIIFLDHATHADPRTQELLASFARSTSQMAVLVLLTFSDDSRIDSPIVSAAREAPTARRLRLQPLDDAEIEELLASMVACAKEERSALTQRLQRESGGNPRVVIERVNSLVSNGLLAPDGQGVWRLRPDEQAHEAAGTPSDEVRPRYAAGASPLLWLRARGWRSHRVTLALAACAVLLAILVPRFMGGRTAVGPTPVLAVGMIRSFGQADSSGVLEAVPDMLATNLARIPTLGVVSRARTYEILANLGEHQLTPQTLLAAARAAGAAELLEGELYRQPDGRMRLDLRRVAVASGTVRAAYNVAAVDAFELVDRATEQIAADLNLQRPPASLTEVTTTSAVAYALYEEGIRAYYQGDANSAGRLLRAALAEDSLFAMAAWYVLLANDAAGVPRDTARWRRMPSLADRAPERDRLFIRAGWGLAANDPAFTIYAESLGVRYPLDPDALYMRAVARFIQFDLMGGVRDFARVVELDSLSLGGRTPRCRACDALSAMVTYYVALDSFPAAERAAREYVALKPNAPQPLLVLAWVLSRLGRKDETMEAVRRAAPMDPGSAHLPIYPAFLDIRAGQFDTADRLLRDQAAGGSPQVQKEALWFLTISLRYQGRLREALTTARRLRNLYDQEPGTAVSEAVVLFEMGRAAQAIVKFDSTGLDPNAFEFVRKGSRSWNLTHMASAYASAGDTAALPALADSIELLGSQGIIPRNRRLHHHVRGLLLAARGKHEEAVAEFRRAVWSWTAGYTRTNLELAQLLIQLGRPHEAIRVLQPALRGEIEVANYYVTHTDLRELLAQAWDGAGRADSAAVHYRWVVSAWRNADPQFHVRREKARARLTVLGERSAGLRAGLPRDRLE